ncbi:MAG TPA: hypothetical protein VFX02_08070 [Gammaproteobacteria bacterium]|nr:hypothetical protein [Gammaproteobacteria bacterium]
MTSFITRALVSGTTAAAMASIVAAIAGRRNAGSYAAPINATSHIVWGDEAGRQDSPSFKYTATGALLNYGGSIFWASLYEGLVGKYPAPGKALARSALITTAAYITDYRIVSRRFTPGFERRLRGKFLALIYGAFGVGLCIRHLLPPSSTLKAKTSKLKARTTQATRRIRTTLSARKNQPTLH